MSTELTVRSKMQEKLSIIDEQLKSIKALGDSSYKTNGEFKFSPGMAGHSTNIHRCINLSLLISILSFLIEKEEYYNKAAEVCKLSTFPIFEWLGFGFEAWKHDLTVRISIVTQHERISKLKAAKSKLEGFMTEEDRLKNALAEIEELL